MIKDVSLATDNNENYINRFVELMKEYDEFLTQDDAKDDLYTTIVHCDLWINNLMLKYGL